MRTAIRTYQAGGEIDDPQRLLDDRYFRPPVTTPVTPPSDVQPQAGAAGQATPAAPPPRTTPAGADTLYGPTGDQLPPPQPMPSRAIDTAPPKPEVGEDDDLPKLLQQRLAAQQVTRSAHGDNRILSTMPDTFKAEDDPRMADYNKAEALFNTLDPRTQRSVKGQLINMKKQIDTDTRAKNKQARDDFLRDQKQQAMNLDEKYVNTLQTPTFNDQINGGLSNQAKIYDDVIAKGAPKDVQEMTANRKASPLDTMPNTEQKYVVRNLMELNRKLDADNAAQVLDLIGSPPPVGKPARNGLSGRAGANYNHDSVDPLGNHMVRVPGFGLIRIAPEMLDTIDKRRRQGYENRKKYLADLATQREEEGKPGWVARQAAPALDWLSQKANELR